MPLPEKTAAALAGLSEEQRAMLEPVLAAMVEDVGAMLAAVKPEPVADMGKEKMLADEAVKPLKAQIATLSAEKAQLLADARATRIAAARPAVLRLAKSQGIVLADEAPDADVVTAAERIALKAGITAKGDAALAAVALADSLAPVVERTRLPDPPKVAPTRYNEDSP